MKIIVLDSENDDYLRLWIIIDFGVYLLLSIPCFANDQRIYEIVSNFLSFVKIIVKSIWHIFSLYKSFGDFDRLFICKEPIEDSLIRNNKIHLLSGE